MALDSEAGQINNKCTTRGTYGDGWATIDEKHIGFHSYQPRTEK